MKKQKNHAFMAQLSIVLSGLMTTIVFFVHRDELVIATFILSVLSLCYFSRSTLFQNIQKEIIAIPKTVHGITLLVAITVACSMLSNFNDSHVARHFVSWLNLPHLSGQIILFLGTTYFLFFYLTGFYQLFLKKMFLFLASDIQVTTKRKWGFGLLAIVLLFFIFTINQLTPVFFDPGQTNLIHDYNYDGFFIDVIFQTDTDPLFSHHNVFVRDRPSSRQPLFSLFSFPFAAPLYAISRLLFFIPNLYPSLMMWLQFLLTFLSALMIYQLVKKQLKHPKLFLVFYLTTYSMLIFPFILERFIFSLFYLVLLVYLHDQHKEEESIAFIAAIGTNLLAFAMGAVLFDWKSKSSWVMQVRYVIKQIAICLMMLIIFGRLPIFFYSGMLYDSTRWITSEVGFVNQLQQFSEFIFGSFIFPETVVNIRIFPRYEQAIVTNFNLVGLLIIVTCIISVVKNINEYFVKVSAYWLGIAFVLFGLFGWATDQHNLLLFSSFFSFSFVYLFYLLLDQMISKFTWSKQMMTTIISGMALYNFFGLLDLLAFALHYYPTGG